MVYRYIKKVCTVASLVMFFGVLWFIYFLTIPRHSNVNKVRHVGENHGPHVGVTSHPSNQHSVSHSIRQSTLSVSSSKDFNFSREDFFKPKCSDRICSNFFTNSDKPHFKYCVHKTWGVTINEYREPAKSTCVFINGTNRYPIGLASYPGSGNTWVRGLLQKVTGLCIGGVYCDVELRKNGYPGESIRSGVAFMVKSHQIDPRWYWVKYGPKQPFTYFQKREHVPVFSGGVFILRNPFHAMVAEYKRQMWERQPGNHVKTLNESYFGGNTDWDNFVQAEAITWYRTVKGWLLDVKEYSLPPGKENPVLVVRYEDLVQNTEHELEKILEFVQVPYSSEQLHAVVSEGYVQYRRPRGAEFEHYTVAQKGYMNHFVASLQLPLKTSGYDSLDLTSYKKS